MNENLKNRLKPELPFEIINGVPVYSQSEAYNAHYRPKGNKNAFGYNKRYSDWRKGQINRRIALYAFDNILDNGGGYGDLKRYLNKETTEYFNIDVSSEMIFLDDSENRVVGSGESLPFIDKCFSTVVSGDVLEHVESKEKYIAESFRVLRNGGFFILNTPRTKWRADFFKSIWFWIPILSGLKSNIKYIFTKKPKMTDGTRDVPSDEVWLRGELEKAGFIVLRQRRTDKHLFSFTSRFWCWFADMFIDESKFGHCAFYLCQKPCVDKCEK